MSGVSKNSFDLISLSFEKLKGKFGKGFLATLIVVAPLMLCCFGVVLIPLAVLLWGVLQTGYIRYMRALIKDEKPSYKLLFSEFKNPGVELLLGTILICSFILGGVLFIAPGIILVSLYSMSLFFAEAKKSATPFEAMRDTRKAMKGNYTNMLSFKVLFWLVYALLIIFGLTGIVVSFKAWADYKLISIIVFVVVYIITTLGWSVVTTYYQVTSELFFQELLVYSEADKKEAVEDKKVEIIEETVEEKVVSEQKSEDKEVKKPVRKTTTKTSITKPAQKKTSATSTAKKTTTKSTAKTTTSTAKKTTAKK